jgi:hypothetical protein
VKSKNPFGFKRTDFAGIQLVCTLAAHPAEILVGVIQGIPGSRRFSADR